MMKNYTEEEKIDFLKNTETGVFTDAMRLIKAGKWMDNILPIRPDMRLAGRAFTVTFSEVKDSGQKYYKNFEMIDHIQPGDIVVIGKEGLENYNIHSMMGENMVHAMINKQAAGLVFDGRTRDYGVIAGMSLPAFCNGGPTAIIDNMNLQYTKLNIPVACGGVEVKPGDYIVGDTDGILVISPEDIDKVLYQAERIALLEKICEFALDNNIPMTDMLELSHLKKIPRQ